ncbi:MAG: TonB-dependent receptor plug domain-containing protein [Candidatus Aminicenantes bacterium]
MVKPGRVFFLLVLGSLFLFSISHAQEKGEEKEKKSKKIITEEIVVEAQLPKDFPLSSTSSIRKETMETTSSKDLSEILSYAPGTFVSSGTKNESRLKIRGLGSQRIVMLYDGIPIYEPFFNSFDLKTILADQVENIKIVKGASSVLYGPNALGGVVNIITERPHPPSFSLNTSYDSNETSYLSSAASLSWRNFSFSGFASYEKSEGFKWNNQGKNALRANSDYSRKNFSGKLYAYPSPKSEILLEASYYSSQFGVPAAVEFYSPRYWRFKDWNRFQLHLGGTFPFLKKGHFKLRSYYVRHHNVLDAYSEPNEEVLKWESTYDNHSYGVFLIGSLPYLSLHQGKFSLNLRDDRVRIQADRDERWEQYSHQTFSLGMENHHNLNQNWKLIAGASLDLLKKQSGDIKSSFNPILGIKFNPRPQLDIHASFSRKSRFPSMKSLYSVPGGNPELGDETGTNYELGFIYSQDFFVNGAFFFNRINDLIEVRRLPDGGKMSLNVGRAEIYGFEGGFHKKRDRADFSLNFTFLKGKNRQENRPLDLLPSFHLNFSLNLRITTSLRLSVWGLGVSSSQASMDEQRTEVPGYFILNALLSRSFSCFSAFLKADNLFNKHYITEPGFPMKARTVVIGLKIKLGKNKKQLD